MQCGKQAQLNFSFQLCLDFSEQRIYCKAEKRKQGHCLPQLPASIRAPFSQIATFSFFRFGVEGVVARKERENRKQERGLQRELPLPLGERLTLDVDEACEINVKGIMALLLAQQ